MRNLEISLRNIWILLVQDLKAGALNKALEYTDKNAEIVAVIDADYKVESLGL